VADGSRHPDAPALDAAQLSAQVGTTVLVAIDGGPVELQIHEVTEPRRAGGHESFSVVLKGSAARIEQSTYAMTHPTLGRFELFIVPIAQQPDGILYEALFNRRLLEAEG
jgi:hypothetical protein